MPLHLVQLHYQAELRPANRENLKISRRVTIDKYRFVQVSLKKHPGTGVVQLKVIYYYPS